MARSRFAQIAIAVVAVTVHAASCVAQGSADEASQVVVAVLEPSTGERGSHHLGYSVSLGNSKFDTGDGVLNALAQAKGKHLTVLAHEDVSMGAILTVVSLASKAGYLDYGVFVFDSKRKGMAAVPAFKWVEFSTDPEVMRGLLR